MPEPPKLHSIRHNEDELAYWTRINNIVGLRAAGMTNGEVASRLGVSESYVEKAVHWAANQQREAVLDRVAAKFELMDRRLEQLYQIVLGQVHVMCQGGVFRPEVVKTALLVTDQMRKLWGMDRVRPKDTTGGAGLVDLNDWMKNATYDQLAETARSYGYPVPSPFELEARPPATVAG